MNDTKLRAWDERDLIELLSLDAIGPRCFRGAFGRINENGRTHGRRFMAPAMVSASRMAPVGRAPTMMQFLILQRASPDRPIDFEVTILQEGKHFSSRNARGAQARGRIIRDAQSPSPHPCGAFAHAPPPPGFEEMDPEALPCQTDLPPRLADDVEGALGYPLAEAGLLDFRVRGENDIALSNSPESRMGFWIKTANVCPTTVRAIGRARVCLGLGDQFRQLRRACSGSAEGGSPPLCRQPEPCDLAASFGARG
jgi:acyl-CoA thioesterase